MDPSMDHSFAQTTPLQCPHCGATFTAEAWLIVDGAARPDLLARAAEGTLHTLTCPNGHSGQIDAPLLLYLPERTPPLLFCPPTHTSSEEDAEAARALLAQLRPALGDAWRDEWLDGLTPLPQPVLQAVLRGDEAGAAAAMQAAMAAAIPPGVARAMADIAGQLAAEGVRLETPQDIDRALATRPALRQQLEAAMREAAATGALELPFDPEPEEALPPLLQALADWMDIDDEVDAYRYLLAHPELLTGELDALLGDLLAEAAKANDQMATWALTEYRALLQRSRAAGAAVAFAERLKMTEADFLRHADSPRP